MAGIRVGHLSLKDKDLQFLVQTVSPEVTDQARLIEILRADHDFCLKFIEDERVFRRIMADEEIFLKISPALFFLVLLRKAAGELQSASYTVEKTGSMRVPVFDSEEVAAVLNRESLLVYLADMLSSFTRIRSYVFSFRMPQGPWRRIHFNDLDMISLMELADLVEEPYRLGVYKRIADICLFVLGIFPDYAGREYRYPFSRQLRPQIRGRQRISPEEYEEKGRTFYKRAAEHPSSKELELTDVFWDLHAHFDRVKKPLTFISERYLQYKQMDFF